MKNARVALSALLAPEDAFRSETIYHISRFAMISIMLVTAVGSQLLIVWAQPADLAQALFLDRQLDDLDALMLNAPPQQREAAIAQARRGAERTFGPVLRAVAILGAPVRWVLLYLEVHLLLRLLVQFAGGEETPVRGHRHRRSAYLVLFALLPLILSELVAAGVVVGSGSSIYQTVATYADYQRASTVSLSLLSSVTRGIDSAILKFFLETITNPFVWWSVYVFVGGAGPVLRLPTRHALVVTFVLVALVSLQTGALSIGAQQ